MTMVETVSKASELDAELERLASLIVSGRAQKTDLAKYRELAAERTALSQPHNWVEYRRTAREWRNRSWKKGAA